MRTPNTVTFLAGVARSGTSWLGQIFDSSPEVRFRFQPLFAYEFRNRVNEDSSPDDFNQLIKDIYNTESPFLCQDDRRKSGEYPVFQKIQNTKHLVFKENSCQNIIEPMMRKYPKVKLVGIVRNPNAVLNSWMQNPREFPDGSVPLDEWRYGDCKNQGHEDFFGFYKWKEATNIYLDLHEKWPERVYIVPYENLVSNAENIAKEMFTFCDINFETQTADFLNQSTKQHVDSPYSVYKEKSVAVRWKNELDPYITDEIAADLSDTRLERFLQ